MRIAVLHHDPAAAGALSVVLARFGYRPVAFTGGEALADALAHEQYDLLVMRWDGPDLCGVALMHRLRTRHAHPPATVLILTDDAPGCIGEAADALLGDPSSDADIEQAISAAIASRGTQGALREQFGKLLFDRAASQVLVGGHPVLLTAKEFALALLFMRNTGQALSRDQIMTSVWGRGDQPGSRTLDAHVAQVRKRLALRPDQGWRLSSVYGFGYRLDKLDG